MNNFKALVNQYKDIFFYTILQQQLNGCASVLDVGCGSDSPIQYLKKTFHCEGIDIHKRSIKVSQKRNIHSNYRIGNILNIDKYYKRSSFDAVIALDVIEHLQKAEGLQLINKMEKIAKNKIVILTPNGVTQQHPYDDNPHQKHKSGWIKKDFELLKYRVYGLRSFKFIRGGHADITLKPWLFWGFIAFITEPLLYFFPSLSFDLFAVKILKISDTLNEKNKLEI
ncbi:MAG: class I SAM-dependent methyltransferase [Patescibacteria group bacterium]